MIRLGTKIRLSASELDTLRRICGPVFMEPRSIGEYKTLVLAAIDFWNPQGNPSKTRALQSLLNQSAAPAAAAPHIRLVTRPPEKNP